MEELDEKDRKIISLLVEDPHQSQSAIARQLGLSQPAIYARIKRLREKGIMEDKVGINLKNTPLYISKVEMTTKDPWKVLDFFEKCPMYLNGLVTSGRENLCLFFISEKLQAIESCINHHIRNNPNIVDVEFNVVITSAKDWIAPVKIWRQKGEVSPCGKRCTEKTCYSSGKCLGCPSTVFYKGSIL
ncbi:MAG: winged helix-turn-helix transcriptional regulator [Thermoproteota archaeon]